MSRFHYVLPTMLCLLLAPGCGFFKRDVKSTNDAEQVNAEIINQANPVDPNKPSPGIVGLENAQKNGYAWSEKGRAASGESSVPFSANPLPPRHPETQAASAKSAPANASPPSIENAGALISAASGQPASKTVPAHPLSDGQSISMAEGFISEQTESKTQLVQNLSESGADANELLGMPTIEATSSELNGDDASVVQIKPQIMKTNEVPPISPQTDSEKPGFQPTGNLPPPTLHLASEPKLEINPDNAASPIGISSGFTSTGFEKNNLASTPPGGMSADNAPADPSSQDQPDRIAAPSEPIAAPIDNPSQALLADAAQPIIEPSSSDQSPMSESKEANSDEPLLDQKTMREKGIQLYKKRQYDAAASTFKKYLTAYPDEDQEIQWRLAQSLFLAHRWGEAQPEFAKLRGSQRPEFRADAILKEGQIEQIKGNMEAAKQAWNRVVNEYPGAEAAVKARKLLADTP